MTKARRSARLKRVEVAPSSAKESLRAPVKTQLRAVGGKARTSNNLPGGKEAGKVFEQKLSIARKLPSTRSGWSMHDALAHLGQCSRLRAIIETHEVPNRLFEPAAAEEAHLHSPFSTIVRSIISQQVATAAADSILQKLNLALGATNGVSITPQLVSAANFDVVFVDNKKKIKVNGEATGLSEAKMRYIQSLTEHFMDPARLQNFDFSVATDEVIREKLLAVKGLGEWSVDMFMLFYLHRANVLATGDLAVRRGICQVYGLPGKALEGGKGEKEAQRVCAHWAPYSTVGCLYMWKIANMASANKTVK